MLEVVLFSGGRGSAKIIPELLKWDSIKLSVIINGYDDGKSTGEIRKFFKMLGPSDIRKNQELLMSKKNVYYEDLKKIFQFRFPFLATNMECKNEIQSFINGEKQTIADISFSDSVLKELVRKLLKGFVLSLKLYETLSEEKFNFSDCSLANCLYAGAYELLEKNFDATIDFFNVLLQVKGEVIPTNLEDKKLIAIRENGEILYNETQIADLRSSVRIRDIFLVNDPPRKSILDKYYKITERYKQLQQLESSVFASEKTLGVISSADVIIYSPGTQHSSLYPSYMTLGIPECIFNNRKALKVFIANIGEDYEIPGYRSDELVMGAYKYLTKNSRFNLSLDSLIDVVLINTHRSNDKESIRYIANDIKLLDNLGLHIVYDNFEDHLDLGKHDPGITVNTILDLYYSTFYRKI